ncbi:CheR family methyltransferase [Methylobacterium symbioticum]|uniref:CheR family methyltransferase n=1 Tax=uncultured Methylobacterium sp. TaxID=157278 RepID=UPI00259867D8|nr:protein-glutamate O-methyltransferase CheR [uncultured Methylobacterium sp.]
MTAAGGTDAARAARTGAARTLCADPGYAALKAQIIARTGHHYYADKDDLLADRLRRRFRARGVPDAGAYALLLAAEPVEWRALEAEITIGETFFFRYAEQFAALRATILPDLIAARAAEQTLRIWSAGCSTGAEPYSVAILAHELIGPALPAWQVTILGTDISAAALATARAAEYGRWALRTSPAEERRRYFLPLPPKPGAAREGGYALKPEYRRMVRFERANLLDLLDGRAPPHLDGFDLILCRNVLIYFDAATVAGLMRALARRLRPGGWLLIGHAEPSPVFADWLDAVSLPGTVAYRRPGDGAPMPPPAPSPATPPAPWIPPELPPLPALPSAPPPEAARDGHAAAASGLHPAPLPAAPSPPDPGVDGADQAADILPRLRALADAGDTGAAWRLLREGLAARPTDATLRFYEGLIAGALGRDAEAERAFRAAVYLEPGFVMAHYHLGLLLAGLGQPEAARRALDNAARLSQSLPQHEALREGDGGTAAEIGLSAARARDGIGHGIGRGPA